MNSITSWHKSDRPREKLMTHGRAVLSNAELIALIIGNGYKEKSAVCLSRELLSQSENNLNKLAKLSLEALKECKGIGHAKAISIIAAFELGRRRSSNNCMPVPNIQSSKSAYNIIKPKLLDLPHEEMWVLLLDRANKLIATENIGKGGISATYSDIRILFQKALSKFTSSIILAHNHPSGNLTPSNSDIHMTKRIQKAGKLLNIELLDHIIIGDNDYFSLLDNGIISK